MQRRIGRAALFAIASCIPVRGQATRRTRLLAGWRKGVKT
jgi:hypothetical protein